MDAHADSAQRMARTATELAQELPALIAQLEERSVIAQRLRTGLQILLAAAREAESMGQKAEGGARTAEKALEEISNALREVGRRHQVEHEEIERLAAGVAAIRESEAMAMERMAGLAGAAVVLQEETVSLERCIAELTSSS
jgi:hypothetical protein